MYHNVAAIDIGSNAVRLLIASVRNGPLGAIGKKEVLIRIPLRLGDDSFTNGVISQARVRWLIHVMKAFHYLMRVQQVRTYMAFAGSALREAANSEAILAAIQAKAGLTVQPLTVNEEALFLYESYAVAKLLPHRNYLYADVGGGTTEIVLLENGRLAEAKRFNVGTVRQLVGKEQKSERQALIDYLARLKATHTPVALIGTGGNINKIARLLKTTRDKAFTLRSLQLLHNKLRQISVEGRMSLFDLAPDRADVIVPACDIFIQVAKAAGITKFIVPTRGLVDGMVKIMTDDTPTPTPQPSHQPPTKPTMETSVSTLNHQPLSSTFYQGEDSLDWDWIDDDDDDGD